MAEDIYYQRAEFLIVRGYLPNMNIEKVSKILKEIESANVVSTIFVNSVETVYGNEADEIRRRVAALPTEVKELITQLERDNAKTKNENTAIGDKGTGM